MSTIYPTTKEIKDSFIQSIKRYLTHYNHLLICKLGCEIDIDEFSCSICRDNKAKRFAKNHKRIDDFLYSKKLLDDDYQWILRHDNPVKSTDYYYTTRQLDPVIKNLWLCKSIRDTYRQAIYNHNSRIQKTYAFIKHRCGHLKVDEVLYYSPKKLSNISITNCAFNRRWYVDDLKRLRHTKCCDCINDENRNILLRWYDSHLQAIIENITNIYMRIKHVKY